jgi:hypothetical protein
LGDVAADGFVTNAAPLGRLGDGQVGSGPGWGAPVGTARGAGRSSHSEKSPQIRERRATTDRPMVLSCSASRLGVRVGGSRPGLAALPTRMHAVRPTLADSLVPCSTGAEPAWGSHPGPVRVLGLASVCLVVGKKVTECPPERNWRAQMARGWHGARKLWPKWVLTCDDVRFGDRAEGYLVAGQVPAGARCAVRYRPTSSSVVVASWAALSSRHRPVNRGNRMASPASGLICPQAAV